ncbi:MAG: VOC family protein [Gammaproteobacteria bacterium]|nr:VOC family protein [Gammaproteobacteria bacterium]
MLQLLAAPAALAAEEVNILARIHFNTQTADFERAREFYRMLGYTQGVNNFPKTNTHAMARSLGMYDLCTYEIESIEVMSIPGALGPTSIDLIQFNIPFNNEPPYSSPNHLGMAYAALGTSSFDADYNYLLNQGVNFLSEPFGNEGERFVFMQDPDGVFLKLTENSEIATADNGATTNINSMPHIGINVSDFEASLDFYRSLGYTNIEMLPEQGSPAEAAAYGLDRAFTIRGADVSLAGGDGHTLRLMQWVEPFNPEPPYPPPISHIGIHRIALAVANLDSVVAALTEDGVEFLSEIAPCCSGTGLDETGIVNAIDPDGIFVEFVGSIEQRPLQPTAAICSDEARGNDTVFFRDTVP